MLYSREYSTFLVTTIRGFHVLFQSLFMQIKYLRVPDNLLDIVKDEQNRARDANRNSRGGHNGGECRNIYIYIERVIPLTLLCLCRSGFQRQVLVLFRIKIRSWRLQLVVEGVDLCEAVGVGVGEREFSFTFSHFNQDVEV